MCSWGRCGACFAWVEETDKATSMTTKGMSWRRLEQQLAEPSYFDRLLEQEEEMEAESFQGLEMAQQSGCYQLGLTMATQDKGTITVNLFVKEPDTWRYSDSFNGINMAGRYQPRFGTGGTAFTDQQRQNNIFFLSAFVPLPLNKYTPGSVLSKGTGYFQTPPPTLRLKTPHIDWEVVRVGGC